MPGERAVCELLDFAPERVRTLLVQRERPFPTVLERAHALGLRVQQVASDAIAEVMRARNSAPALARGIVAVAEPPRTWTLEDVLDSVREHEGKIPNCDDVAGDTSAPPTLGARPRAAPGERRTVTGRHIIVALDGVQDPRNLGAIIRSAEFFGATSVLWTRDRAASLSPTVVRASAGASERLPLIVETNLARAVDVCKETGFWALGTVVDGARSLRELCADGLPSHLVVIVGREDKGLRRLTRERCDFLATICGAGALGSLNVSAATAVLLASLA